VNPATTQRLSAAERKDEILDAAMVEFAERGLHGTSTEDIARRAGISQPYLFRLFHTKKELYKASVRRCMTATLEVMQTAAAGHTGQDALHAIGDAYIERLRDPLYLRAQMQAYAACDDPEIREIVRQGYGALVDFAGRISGAAPSELSAFFAQGMLLNVLASMQVLDASEPWAEMLLEGCRKALDD
jgi:AcrR family transcriptional regulator